MGELPVLKKCCFCVPLRYGLLTWGYIKLAISVTALIGYLILLVTLGSGGQNKFVSTIVGVLGILIVSEVVIHILFIIGAHKKNVKYLRIYYTYSIVIWVAILIMSVIGTILLIILVNLVSNNSASDTTVKAIVFSVHFSCIVFAIASQTSLVLAIRSEIIKLRSTCPYRYVKNDNEHEDTIKPVQAEEEIINDNGTVRIS